MNNNRAFKHVKNTLVYKSRLDDRGVYKVEYYDKQLDQYWLRKVSTGCKHTVTIAKHNDLRLYTRRDCEQADRLRKAS